MPTPAPLVVRLTDSSAAVVAGRGPRLVWGYSGNAPHRAEPGLPVLDPPVEYVTCRKVTTRVAVFYHSSLVPSCSLPLRSSPPRGWRAPRFFLIVGHEHAVRWISACAAWPSRTPAHLRVPRSLTARRAQHLRLDGERARPAPLAALPPALRLVRLPSNRSSPRQQSLTPGGVGLLPAATPCRTRSRSDVLDTSCGRTALSAEPNPSGRSSVPPHRSSPSNSPSRVALRCRR